MSQYHRFVFVPIVWKLSYIQVWFVFVFCFVSISIFISVSFLFKQTNTYTHTVYNHSFTLILFSPSVYFHFVIADLKWNKTSETSKRNTFLVFQPELVLFLSVVLGTLHSFGIYTIIIFFFFEGKTGYILFSVNCRVSSSSIKHIIIALSINVEVVFVNCHCCDVRINVKKRLPNRWTNNENKKQKK